MVSELLNITCLDCIDSGANWLYSSVDKFFFLSIKFTYLLSSWTIFDESFNFYFLNNWYSLFSNTEQQIFTSIFLDYYYELNNIKLSTINEWLKNIFDSVYTSYIYTDHPELLFIKALLLLDSYIFFNGSLYVSLYTSQLNESFNLIIFSITHYIVVLLLLSFLFILYFSPYINSTHENTVDLDFSATSLLIEAEKEISSIDDIILFSVTILYIFGWFFYLNIFTFLSTRIYTASILILLPFFFFTIIGIPSLLIYDFGLFFLVYLRGAGTTSLFLFELMYDYIAVMVFYTRIIVQNIRLLLMFFTVISLYDVFLFFNVSSENIFKNLNVHESYNIDYFTEVNTSYSFFFFTLK